MKEKDNFLRRYLCHSPAFLAMERAIECRLISKLELKRPILDLGCGDGLFSSILFSEPPEIGIDISLGEIVIGKKRYRNAVIGDLSILPLKTKSFNTIICNSVMEHVIDLKKAIKEAHRVLSLGGEFILTLPTENYEKFLFYPRMFQGLGLKSLANCYKEAMNKIFKHYHAYSAAQWIKVIEDNGFKAIKTTHYCSRNALGLTDISLPFSFISLLNKKIFKRWIFWPSLRKYTAKYLELLLRKHCLSNDSGSGACIFIEAQCV